MTELRTWHEVLIADLAASRTEAIDYFDLSLQEYQLDGDTPFFLKGLWNIIEALGGVPEIAKQTGTEPEKLLEVLSSDDPPRLDTLTILANAQGCRLSIEPQETENPSHQVKDKDYSVAARKSERPRLEMATD